MEKAVLECTFKPPNPVLLYPLAPHNALDSFKSPCRYAPSQWCKSGPWVPTRGRSWQARCSPFRAGPLSPGFWAVEPDLSEVRGMETCLCVPQSTIPSFCLCGPKTQVPESMLKSPNKPSGKPCISGKAHNKQTVLAAWERMGSVTLHSNLSAAAPCV